ncbi:hypothetical protein [Azoarcus olearius]|uniref:hypothetical protein n=1 Tax=Azoarcus sp. (strain BH72) TaxID=418699 RepID=UPI0012EEDA1A|nr:hypothetical protein [Azoarcus olearius]
MATASTVARHRSYNRSRLAGKRAIHAFFLGAHEQNPPHLLALDGHTPQVLPYVEHFDEQQRPRAGV